MHAYQKAFIDFCLKNHVLKFGEFLLKSGRKSPYFFNAALFNTGEKIAELGKFYAKAIIEANIEFDLIFGPSYKGIPLAVTTSIALANQGMNLPFSFNRKTPKSHGEGGIIVGAPLKGEVLLVDDVITAGTAIRESLELIKNSGAHLKTVVIALDRQERGQRKSSAIDELKAEHGVSVISIIKLDELIEYISNSDQYQNYLEKIEAYRKRYGIN